MAIHKMPIHKMRIFSCSRIFSASRLQVVSALLGASICLPVTALAQSQDAQSPQDSSVADAARRSREKKKNPSTSSKFSKVITDDDLAQRNYQPGPDVLNVGASASSDTVPPKPPTVAPAEAADNASEEDLLKEAKEQDAEIATLKLKISNAEKDLNLDQRQLALDQDSYFANPDYSHDVAGKAKLDSEKQQINDKQQDIERLKTRLAAVEELKSRRKPAQTRSAPPPAQPTPPATQPAPPPQTEQPENPPL
jgi:hypothetical protein